ncbi:F-box protein At3g17710-like [Lolium perenne]|uniref:F-box protein At3g17710-like n=1 Tax=Lolium perenne TaxID=4522 RepID=UPI0021F52D00|nr:uncharacterized protein LOC127339317 [Lolium perenne]
MAAADATATTPPAPPLPDDILVEIFLLLPAKSVLRFRAVCTPWRLLLSDLAFVREHHRRAPHAILLSNPIIDNGDAVSALPFPYADQSTAAPLYCGTTCQQTFLYECCDGLLLLRWSRALSVGVYRHAPTAEYRVLGYNSYWWSPPSIGQHRYEYLVAAPGQERARKLEPTDVWTSADCINSRLDHRPVIHRGCLHWMSWFYSKGAVVFDTISEEFRPMQGPLDGDARMDRMHGRLVALDGTLGASVYQNTEKDWIGHVV